MCSTGKNHGKNALTILYKQTWLESSRKKDSGFFYGKDFLLRAAKKAFFSCTPFVFLALLLTFVYNERKGRDRNMHFTKGGNL